MIYLRFSRQRACIYAPMEQLVFFDIPSPCIGVCQTDAKGYCKGCFRNREERFDWLNFSDARKLDVIRLCKARKRRWQLAQIKARREQLKEEELQLNHSLDFDAQGDEDESLDFSDFSLD